jgi:hypothetical protein
MAAIKLSAAATSAQAAPATVRELAGAVPSLTWMRPENEWVPEAGGLISTAMVVRSRVRASGTDRRSATRETKVVALGQVFAA